MAPQCSQEAAQAPSPDMQSPSGFSPNVFNLPATPDPPDPFPWQLCPCQHCLACLCPSFSPTLLQDPALILLLQEASLTAPAYVGSSPQSPISPINSKKDLNPGVWRMVSGDQSIIEQSSLRLRFPYTAQSVYTLVLTQLLIAPHLLPPSRCAGTGEGWGEGAGPRDDARECLHLAPSRAQGGGCLSPRTPLLRQAGLCQPPRCQQALKQKLPDKQPGLPLSGAQERRQV